MRYLNLDREQKKRKRRRLKRISLIVVSLAVLFVGGLILWKGDFLFALLRPISFVSQLVNPVHLKEDDGRVNVLVLGLDSRSNGGTLNTDTILVGSFSLTEGDPVLVSIPRDLWVRSNSVVTGWQGKINTAFANAALRNGTINEEDGVAAAKAVVEEVLGIPLHYWAIVDFEGFEKVVDTLGGVEVCVDRAFDDYMYPIPGRESSLNPYEHLHFDAGCQLMDGDTALKYSRSRMGTSGEGSDFARVRRQQKVIMAVKEKIFSLSLIFDPVKLVDFYNELADAIKTDASFGEVRRALELLYDFQEGNGVRSLVLDPESGLTRVGTAAEFGGAYVLVPKVGDFSAIHAAVQDNLFGVGDEEAASE
jgi:LCP family protein required for cell wall assembly